MGGVIMAHSIIEHGKKVHTLKKHFAGLDDTFFECSISNKTVWQCQFFNSA